MAELIDLATTAAGNTERFPENMQFRAVNDAARELEAMIARDYRDRNGSIQASGSSNAFAITTNQTITSYADNQVFCFTANHTITGPATLNVNGLGARSITAQDGSALGRNDIVSGQKVLVVGRAATSTFQILGGRVAGSSADVTARIVKAGSMMMWGASTPPTGWLECDGSAVSRTTYAELFSAIGTSYGVGDGSTTFNLPDLRGEFIRGWDHGRGVDPDRTSRTNRGDGTTGDNIGTKQAAAYASHSHGSGTLGGISDSIADHAHTYTVTISQNVGVAGGSAAQVNSGTTTASTSGAGSHQHILTITGSTASSGGNETRPRNVSSMIIILASPAQASAATLGLAGFSYSFDTGTADANPGAGKLRFNNASVASATAIYLSETDGYGAPLGPVIQALPANTGLYIFKVGDPSTYAAFTMGATAVDAGAYDKLQTLTYIGSNGTFASNDPLAVIPMRAGATGSTGAQGADGGIRWTFDSSTTMGDPGAGDLRLNNATLASVTAIALSANNAETGNPDISDWIAGWDDSTTTAQRGQIIIRKATATQNYVILNLTSAITDNTTWLTGTVSVAASNGSFSASDPLLVSFHRTGDKGLDGAGSGTVTSVTAGGGLSASGVGASGGSVTVSGTVTSVRPVNAQTGTTYTFVTGDNAKLVTFSNASAVAVTLPQATSTFGAGWHAFVENRGAGAVTITPTTSTINGAATLELGTNQGCQIVSDGTNYQVVYGAIPASGATAGTYTNATVTVNKYGLVTSISSGSSSGGAPSPPQGRLTLSTGGPVMTSIVGAATTLYYTPYVGRYVPLYNGSAWSMTDIGGELSQATTDSTKSPAACTTNSNYDIFVWNDGGTYRATRGPAWSSSTSRGTGAGTTELELFEGILVNKNAITNGPAARRGTYVGSVRTNGSSQLSFIYGALAVGGTAAVLGVWNMYNRVDIQTTVQDSTDSWTYGSSTFRQANASAGMQVSFISGWAADAFDAVYSGIGTASASGSCMCAIGYDSTSAKSGTSGFTPASSTAALLGRYGVAALGFHYVAGIEVSTAGTATFYGDSAAPTTLQSGLWFKMRM